LIKPVAEKIVNLWKGTSRIIINKIITELFSWIQEKVDMYTYIDKSLT